MIYHDWISILGELRARREPCVLLTVLEEKGSVPRDSGSKMVVTADHSFLTIGGGHLEYQCIAQARAMLQSGQQAPHSEHFSLGARLGQCCGGMSTILFEPLMQQQPQIAVFGAGHVGQALVNLLSTLPCHVNWIDEREGQFAQVPAGVSACFAEDPLEQVAAMPAGSYFIVMTHHHPRDLELCEAILRRGDYRYFGVIGSATKRQRFDYRLEGKGFSQQQLATMRCPIGLADVKGKLPAEIAVAIAGEIIAVYQRAQ
ncbi:xanthine dehydrogenase accessory protein XdhC [Erwiniaceae bacterium BAC15a-03b]|uniref:Xanthine dehydrogenase accessory protein XdhC n=1 Tax=Winslowiella arboricola TaxID=2978220 RepID=A0A9J6Q0J9_9GAMM|nr:xanthine dehydrogenase accessory protein XdhC [Winslowiella arboricola]MCU5772424.1 xanthine dehydrogenase accessory protein XdhC [Winslowiella arboricola]MCU5779783.1 xanthine dehydrogenase accessory protein XdhC [Winslowiella arboricola]